MISRMDILGCEGTPMRVLFIPAGEQNPNFPAAINRGHDIVEFFDLRHMHTPDGQFTGGRYCLDTLMDDDKWIRGKQPERGLCLYGSEPSWQITPETLGLVLNWADYHISRGVYQA